MCDPETNYVKVDEEFDVITVYDTNGEFMPREFTLGSQAERRDRAEIYAAHLAVQLGCDWGTNYP